jgi:hypothetical protein
VCGRTTACFWLDKISGIGHDFEDHIACVVSENAMWVRVEVVHDHGGSGDGVGHWGGLFGCDFIECWDAAILIHEGAIDSLDSGGALLVENLGFEVWGGALWFARAVGWFDPLVWRMLWA